MASNPASREMHLLLWPQYKPRKFTAPMSPKKLFRSPGERKQIEERKDLGACAHEEPIKSPPSLPIGHHYTHRERKRKKKGPWWMKTLMMEIYTDPCSVWLFGESSHGVGVFRLVLIQPGGICMCICVSTETLAGTGAAINPLKG